MTDRRRWTAIGLVIAAVLGLAACGSTRHAAAPPAKLRRAGGGIPRTLRSEARPIGRGARYRPPASGPVLGRCEARFGSRYAVHVELFGNNRVVLIAAGIGVSGKRRSLAGRIIAAGCFGSLVTLDPTGTVYLRPGAKLTVGDLFRSWGQPLTLTRIASFTGARVTAYVNGKLRSGSATAIQLRPGAEIVLEVGPHVPPHSHFTFAPLPPASLR